MGVCIGNVCRYWEHPTYRARAYSLLRSILASAVDDGYLPVNPARIRGAGQASRRHQVRPAILDELAALTLAMRLGTGCWSSWRLLCAAVR